MEWNIVNQPKRRAIRQDEPKVIAIAKVAQRDFVTPELAVGIVGSVSLLGYLLSTLAV